MPKQQTKVVWFRSDLRAQDNTALLQACASKSALVRAIYFVTPKQWDAHDLGVPKRAFIHRCLKALYEELSKLRIPLEIHTLPCFSDIPNFLRDWCKKNECTEIYANYEYELNERKRDGSVREQLEKDEIKFFLYHDQLCLPPNHELLKTGAGNPYTVFTPFKKKWVSIVNDIGIPKVQGVPKKRSFDGELPNFLEEQFCEGVVETDPFAKYWPGGEREARKRLNQFVKKGIQDYQVGRDFPALQNGTSVLSPYLSVGAISPRECLNAAIAANLPHCNLTIEKNGAMTWVSELIWREFYRYVLLYHERLCKYEAFKPSVDAVSWRYDEDDFKRWSEGRTGYPLVDAAMRQLNQTGWMHNRLRMVVAMFLTKHLLIDWRWGEKYFMKMLVDADLASNNGGWQWSASTGTDAQPYFRIFNPYSQSQKFDPEGEFIKRFLPELKGLNKKDIHMPSEDQCADLGYPLPVIEHKMGRERALAAFKA